MTNILEVFSLLNRNEQLYIHMSVQVHLQLVHDSFPTSKVNNMAKHTNKQ